MQFENFVPSAEINSIKRNINVKNEGVEIFSAICNGKDLTKYGDKVDKVFAYVKNLGEKAVNGDLQSQAEINAIREVQIQAPLLQRINLFSYMGDFQKVGYNEEIRYKVYQLQGKKAGEQANSGSFAFPTQTWREGSLSTTNITSGLAVDYREFATGNVDNLGIMNEQCITEMMNQMFYNIVSNMYNTISAIALAGGITNFSEAGGINQVALNAAIRIARRWGQVTISADYSCLSQIENFAGFTTNVGVPGSVQFSEAVMEEIRKTGLLKNYRGTNVVEIPNAYDLTKINAGGTYFDSYLPEGLLFLIPKTNMVSPLQVGIKGGVTSMSGQDINLGLSVQRFDLNFGSVVIPEYVPMLGVISDSNFVVDKR